MGSRLWMDIVAIGIVLIFLALAIGIGIALIRWLIGNSKKTERVYFNTALEQLKVRYVKGEISKEEFEQMKKDIQ